MNSLRWLIWIHGHRYYLGLGWYCRWPLCGNETTAHRPLCPIWLLKPTRESWKDYHHG